MDAVVDLSFTTIGDGLWAANTAARSFDLTDCQLTGRLWATGLRCERVRAERLVADGLVNLSGALGGGYLNLSRARIGGALDLSQTDEVEPCFEESTFDGIDCSGEVDFRNRVFGLRSSFRSAHFRGPVDFGGAHWPEGQPSRGIFRDCIFEKIVEFRGSTSVPFAAFDGIAAKADIRINRRDFLKHDAFREQIRRERDEDGLESLENGCRALKLSANASHNRLSEQSFYRFELLARRARPSTATVERIASVVYQQASDFGLSFTKPLFVLVLSWFAFAMVYDASAWRSVHSPRASSFNFSGQQVFKPFSAWSEPSHCPQPQQGPDGITDTSCKLLGADASVALAIRLLSSLQSIVSTAMLFLFALAIKRRFQIV